jgi:hypothetical protein
MPLKSGEKEFWSSGSPDTEQLTFSSFLHYKYNCILHTWKNCQLTHDNISLKTVPRYLQLLHTLDLRVSIRDLNAGMYIAAGALI